MTRVVRHMYSVYVNVCEPIHHEGRRLEGGAEAAEREGFLREISRDRTAVHHLTTVYNISPRQCVAAVALATNVVA